MASAPVPVTDLAKITATGLSLPGNLSVDEWEEIGETLLRADKALQWAIGDWWVYGEHRYGERAAAAIDPATNQNRLQRFMNYGWVARKIETSRRRDVLSWSAHEAVAGLDDPDIQDRILDRAAAGNWGSREVRAAVKEYKSILSGRTRIIDVAGEDDAPSADDEDRPVFDGSDFGSRTTEERQELLDAYREQDVSTGNQGLLKTLDFLERQLSDKSALDYDGLSLARLRKLEADFHSLVEDVAAHQEGWPAARKPLKESAEIIAHMDTAAGDSSLGKAGSVESSDEVPPAAGSTGEFERPATPISPLTDEDLEIPSFLDRRARKGRLAQGEGSLD